jgi:MinD superfamily P-loop ATPase
MDRSEALLQIIQERCNLCGDCIPACRRGASSIVANTLEVDTPEECDGCGNCEDACPADAIQCAFEIVWDEQPRSASSSTKGA